MAKGKARSAAGWMNDPAVARELEPVPPLLVGQSPLEDWDAALECAHGRLPREECVPCSRPRSTMFPEAYPGPLAMAKRERSWSSVGSVARPKASASGSTSGGSLPPSPRRRSTPPEGSLGLFDEAA